MRREITQEQFYTELESKGHKLIRDEDGEIDTTYGSDYHNGPSCELCNASWCHHCRDETEPCPSAAAGADSLHKPSTKQQL